MRGARPNVPKSLAPVAGRPLLARQLDWLKASGFKEAALCLGHGSELIREWLESSSPSIRVSCHVEERPRGTAGAVRDLPFCERDDLLVIYGDIYLGMDARPLEAFHAGHAAAATLAAIDTDHPLDSDLLRTDGDRVTGIYRARPGEPHDTLACAAVWVVPPRADEAGAPGQPERSFRDIFPLALREGLELRAYRTSEPLVDIGTPERLKALEERLARTRRDPSARPT